MYKFYTPESLTKCYKAQTPCKDACHQMYTWHFQQTCWSRLCVVNCHTPILGLQSAVIHAVLGQESTITYRLERVKCALTGRNTWLSVAESVTEFIDVDLDHDLDQSWQSVDSEVTEMLSGSEENE